MITRVSGSSARNSRTSDSETSALFPMLTTLEYPMLSPIDRSRMAVQSAPDCERKPMFPFAGVPLEKEAFRRAWVSITPRQFGPTTRIPVARAMEVSSRSRVTPAPPTSLNPAEMAMAAFIPLAARAGNAFRMSFGATTNTPRSTGPGIASTEGYNGRPSSSPPPGFTPYSGPGNPVRTRFAKTPYPTFSGFRDAPTTATDFGWNSSLGSTKPL